MKRKMKKKGESEEEDGKHEIITLAEEITSEINHVINAVDGKSVDEFADLLSKAKRIFVAGMGRSQLVGRMFAVRLLQMEIETYVVGDPLTPAITKDDLLIAISGSGRTQFPIYAVHESKKRGIPVVVITAKKGSPITKNADVVILLPTKTKYDLNKGSVNLPLGTMFELATAVFLDTFITYVKDKLGVTEEDMLEHHSVIE